MDDQLPAAAAAAAQPAAAEIIDPLAPAPGAAPILRTHQVSIHSILQFLPVADCLRLALTCRRLRVLAAARGDINTGVWHRVRALVSLASPAARAAGVIMDADNEPLPGLLAEATPIGRHVEFRLVLTRVEGLNGHVLPGLQRSHVGVTTGNILHMPSLRGLDLRNIRHRLSSAVPLLQQLASDGAPPLAELILPGVADVQLADNVFNAVRRLPHLRSLTCTNPSIQGHAQVGALQPIIPSPLTHLHASDADCENLHALHADHLISLRLDTPRRLPRLFLIHVQGVPAGFPPPPLFHFHQLTDVRLSNFNADLPFPIHEHGGPPLPADHYWNLIWPCLPRLLRLTLERVRNIDTLLESLLPLHGPAAAAAAPGPTPCLELREITIPDGDAEFQPSVAMVHSLHNRTHHPARAEAVQIVFDVEWFDLSRWRPLSFCICSSFLPMHCMQNTLLFQ
jgi:hypothetical protein